MSLRSRLRARFFRFLRHVADIEDTREIFATGLRRHNAVPRPVELDELFGGKLPYDDLGSGAVASSPAPVRPVFITGRFRSGSTLLWNLFRQIPSVTSYYEPFNERRWFDKSARGGGTDPTHLGVDEYWREYDGLDELGAFFDEEWKFRHLYMNADSVDMDMHAYIETMIRKAPGRPVLQFNEVDFRLGWLRAQFPDAALLHIYRHPREQWLSTLRGVDLPMAALSLDAFRAVDAFYLWRWGKDLQYYFPFLDLRSDTHPYRLFYQLWRLSYELGVRYADLSVSLEQIVAAPRPTIERIMGACGQTGYDLDRLQGIVSPSAVRRSSTPETDALCAAIEARVERELAALPRGAGSGTPPRAGAAAGGALP